MKNLFPVLFLVFLVACGGDRKAKPMAEQPFVFRLPEIPSYYTNADERARYLFTHYWDNFDFKDTVLYKKNKDKMEQAFADYIFLFRQVPLPDVEQSVNSLLRCAQGDSALFTRFTGLFEHYLYDPNSPYRNDEYYIPVLQTIIAIDSVSELVKIRPRVQLDLALKNRLGQQATNINFMPVSGKPGSLYNINTDYVILFFYNPGCEACRAITEQMRDSERIGNLIRSKKLTVLAVYPDRDLKLWRQYRDAFPAGWINSYDPE